ncbi:MAG: hypothetical protein AAF830_11640 [Pseudomonadota bacterium]
MGPDNITGNAAGHLARLRGEVILLGETRLNLRGIVHNAICALASKNDAEIQERMSVSQKEKSTKPDLVLKPDKSDPPDSLLPCGWIF